MPRKYVDYVLVWESSSKHGSKSRDDEDGGAKSIEELSILQKRKTFEKNLEEEGLQLEREELEGSRLNFVKIHASMAVLRRYAEILRLRMPMKETLGDSEHPVSPDIQPIRQKSRPPSKLQKFARWCGSHFDYDDCKFPPLNQHQRLNTIYSRDKEYLFDVEDIDFFTPSIRSSIVDFIIQRKHYSNDPHDGFALGIGRLINDKVYTAAYPLHDGDLKSPGGQRQLLYTEWASLKNSLKCQPLDYIKEYFGVKITLYFAWLGFYTRMLIPASILGFFCFLYGIGTLHQDEYSEEICEDTTHLMCPLCTEACRPWNLSSICGFSQFTYVFDNNATVVFAVLMSFWAAIFLEFWKRYSARITYKWDLVSFEATEEPPRLEYLARVKRLKKLESDVMNTITEPHVSFWKTRVPYHLLSLTSVLFLVTMAVAVILAVITYRVIMTQHFDKDPELHSLNLMMISASSAGINLLIIIIFNLLYTAVAQYLTDMELHRTQTEFDDALTLKIFILQFVNFYSSIFYIAFFKGRFAPGPNQRRTFFNEKCGTAGCMTELCIQLAIIMVGKQFVGGVLEMTLPVIQKWIRQLKFMVNSKKRKTRRPAFVTQWLKDFKLSAWHSRSLFNEYLEMVIQYGFVTIFVAAFPLAPFFALLNNVLEMRLDATKMLIYNRRPVGQRVKNIGIWYGILDMISRIAVISNAVIIALTSNFIPRVLHFLALGDEEYAQNMTLVQRTLVSFDTADLPPRGEPTVSTSILFGNESDTQTYASYQNVDVCWYQDYAYNHTRYDSIKYTKTKFYWTVLIARLIFVLAFQNIVSMCVLILKVIIPDVPQSLQKRIRHENHLTSEIIIKQESIRARGDPDFYHHDTTVNNTPTPTNSSLLQNIGNEIGLNPFDSPGISHHEIPVITEPQSLLVEFPSSSKPEEEKSKRPKNAPKRNQPDTEKGSSKIGDFIFRTIRVRRKSDSSSSSSSASTITDHQNETSQV